METSRKYYPQHTHRCKKNKKLKKLQATESLFLLSFDSFFCKKRVNLKKLRENSMQWEFNRHVNICSDLKKKVDSQEVTVNKRMHCLGLQVQVWSKNHHQRRCFRNRLELRI